nr:FAD-linked sulfhydryl oxidase ERV1 [Tanacetum cinerariifolium]
VLLKPYCQVSSTHQCGSTKDVAVEGLSRHRRSMDLGYEQAGPVTREELGRATWTFIHTLGAQVYSVSQKPTGADPL